MKASIATIPCHPIFALISKANANPHLSRWIVPAEVVTFSSLMPKHGKLPLWIHSLLSQHKPSVRRSISNQMTERKHQEKSIDIYDIIIIKRKTNKRN